MGGQKMFDANLGWKHLSELQNTNPKDIKSERIKRLIGLILGPVLFVIILLMQTPADMTEPAKQILAIVLWLLPSIVGAIAGRKSDIAVTFDTIFDSAYVSIFLALVCFLLPIKRLPDGRVKPLSTWTKACKHVNWGVLFLVASALLIGGAMNAEGVGLIAGYYWINLIFPYAG